MLHSQSLNAFFIFKEMRTRKRCEGVLFLSCYNHSYNKQLQQIATAHNCLTYSFLRFLLRFLCIKKRQGDVIFIIRCTDVATWHRKRNFCNSYHTYFSSDEGQSYVSLIRKNIVEFCESFHISFCLPNHFAYLYLFENLLIRAYEISSNK